MSPTLQATHPDVEVVTAPAGSGKTTLLIYHLVRQLRAGIPIERIVAITFTRKAAAELVERLGRVLGAAVWPDRYTKDELEDIQSKYGAVLPSAAQALGALATLDSAAVSTVDAFTLSLVQEFLLDAHFRLSDGQRVYLDGPIGSGGDCGEHYTNAARQQIEALGKAARLLLDEMTLGDAIDSVATLAALGTLETPTLAQTLATLGQELAPVVREQPEPWLDAAGAAPASVGAWLRARRGTPPVEMLPFVFLAKKNLAALAAPVIRKTLKALGLDAAGVPEARGLAKDAGLQLWNEDAVERADRLRAALLELAAAARDDALRAIAGSRVLGYDEILLAATTLCESRPKALVDRFDVLLVDELQDTNPAQLAFYKAFVGMRDGTKPIRRFFVGDSRQSIYRFRQADPFGWQSLVRGAERAGTHARLTVSYRSSRALIDAQRELFGRIARWVPEAMDAIDDLQPRPKAPAGDEDGPPALFVDAPEHDDTDPYVIAELAGLLAKRWSDPECTETAAVLVRSWACGAWAAEALKAHGIAAQLTGDRALLSSQPATDLRIFLRVIIDPSDDIAMAAALKHPALGVSDAGVLALRKAGLFGRLLMPDVDLSVLGDAEAALLRPALATLNAARKRIGREPTADVLERVAADLQLRPIIEAGPEGAASGGVGLAQLDILLDVVRAQESDTVDPQAVVQVLTPGEDAAQEDLPVVRMHQSRHVVTVTTVFGAKGLEFDHVALLQSDRKGDDGSDTVPAFTLYRPRGKTVLAVRLDPEGGLEPVQDPLGALAAVAGGDEKLEEGLRLFYVGFTRAKSSVVVGLNKDKSGVVSILREMLQEGPVPGTSIIAPDDSKLGKSKPLVHGRTGALRPLEARWAAPQGYVFTRPSSAAELGLHGTDVAERFRAQCSLTEAPRGPTPPAGMSVPEITLGSVVHGWLERWGLKGEPSETQALDYLRERWSADDAAVARWLLDLGLHLRDQLPEFRQLLAEAARVHFEWPLIGLDETTIWRGRADLVVEHPGREVTVIDFKAGSSFATAEDIPHVQEYAPQLEGYRRMLEAAGYKVREVGLLYVRGPSWVRVRY